VRLGSTSSSSGPAPFRPIKKYLETTAQTPATRSRVSKLDPFKPTIAELLEKNAWASAAVIEQRLRPLGYDGGHSILRGSTSTTCARSYSPSAPSCGWSLRLVSVSIVDWGYFGTLSYEGEQPKLYAFALVDGHSPMSYLEPFFWDH
jgi:hypothetical protein